MTKEKILDLIDEVGAEHPYKVPGEVDTCSQYNEAWADCCDKIARKIEEYFDTTERHHQKYLVTYMYNNNLTASGRGQAVATMDFITEDSINEIVLSLKEQNLYNEVIILNMIKLED